ncbi:hypothetical protein [Noviherbaspirillum aridicola]|uniref:MYXO-CTERM domain-containing protein n=1 Tax=Noviherbaspirillum aridicola TaxID=2849687 RepID=A0ABQ4Q6S0_9BURK|nr:hypothetical protein [Noviherbaspirillum aridicola]GIZ52843.1 hypothetical protein NCCP691_28570 [Noviherbaspirillum aridicola]
MHGSCRFDQFVNIQFDGMPRVLGGTQAGGRSSSDGTNCSRPFQTGIALIEEKEKNVKPPVLVAMLVAAMLAGLALIFFVM